MGRWHKRTKKGGNNTDWIDKVSCTHTRSDLLTAARDYKRAKNTGPTETTNYLGSSNTGSSSGTTAGNNATESTTTESTTNPAKDTKASKGQSQSN